MLSKISAFFQSLNDGNIDSSTDISVEISCAVLLCEVMLADGVLEQTEEAKLQKLITQQFQLAEEDVKDIIKQALALCESATDFYQFTSKINASYSVEQRIKMLELLWSVAYADGELASIEEHIIRKIADLLHLRHTEFIQAKLKIVGEDNTKNELK